ncbi:TetR/AcrR family transcriptional regulator [Heyndrickxia oleronia]|jgi:AcrR family transcriptional regulator|uniref:TetR/AcrR family transcriptional regulator n=1 Tax=Heyndrickxia oleronia TaxID=38875 RepID=UPI00242EBAFA|nr:TetR/AcrR family transcriptional regulator [Heyndrickxia oleronia]MCI1588980.1 TetR/AcrR family transcriptional regulator [Heyndrickxia oleronia]MCI1611928.1 TetR/AcrR family transcriptional regulator [Heyndrickxia oleronia]MCI1743065.1 TetR/AcrR family transcriptional regulator [Heyndrickxia oleronia]MCI1759559.1 TetR/AcrR family transcriptional regulator [Heyndrickxia oleronia]
MSVQYPDKRVKRTKENFRSTLLSLMEEKNFSEITITEIVKAADYNRGTFYAHYKSKEDVLEEIIDEMFEKMTEAFRKPYLQLSVVDLEELSSHSIVLFDHFLENKKFYKLMLSSKVNINFREKMIKKLVQLFREDYSEFTYTEVDPEINIKLFNTYQVHGIIGLILEWIDHDFPYSPAYMGDQLIHILSFYMKKVVINKVDD